MACLSGAVLLDNKQTNLVWCDARSLKSSLERTDRHDMTKMSMKSASITYEDPALLAQKLQADHRLSEQALANFLISAEGVPIIIQDLSLWTTNEAGIQHDDALSAVTRRSRRDEDDDSASVAPFRNNDSFAGLGNSLLQPFEDEGVHVSMCPCVHVSMSISLPVWMLDPKRR